MHLFLVGGAALIKSDQRAQYVYHLGTYHFPLNPLGYILHLTYVYTPVRLHCLVVSVIRPTSTSDFSVFKQKSFINSRSS